MQEKTESGFALILGHIIDFIDGNDCHKGSRISFTDIIHQLAILLFVNNRNNFFTGRMVEGADAVIDGSAAVQTMENEMKDLVMLLRKDTDTALNVDTKDKVIPRH